MHGVSALMVGYDLWVFSKVLCPGSSVSGSAKKVESLKDRK